MTRVLVVDDEPAARRRLMVMLEELDVEVVGEAANGIEALELTRERRPDLLLLDIVMPEVDGFDVIRHLPEPRPLVVFQTAYDEHAVAAFEHEAIDYVVKPVTLARLEQAIDRARRRLAGQSRPPTDDLLERLQRLDPAKSPGRRPRLLVRDGESHRLMPFRDITRFVAAAGSVTAEAAGRSYPVGYTLNELEERSSGGFVRVNRSELINLEQVERFAAEADGSAVLVLAAGIRVHVSRRRTAEVRRLLET